MKHEKQPDLESSALVKHEPQALASPIPAIGIDIAALMEKAIDAKSAVEVVKELREMANQDRAFRARQLFDAAMKAFQADCPTIIKTKGVKDNSGTEAYRFAPIEEVESVIRPICQKHGFSHKFPKMTLGQGSVTAFCEVKHEAGHSETTEVTYRIGTRTRMMSDTQVDAATETFAKRRALCNAYGLVLAGEDRDGAGDGPKPRGPSSFAAESSVKELASELWQLLTPIREKNVKNWVASNQFLWKHDILDGAIPEELPNLSVDRFKEVIAKAKQLPELKG